MSTVRLFVSYSHRDPQYLGPESLLGFLKGLEREENVEFWTDERIEGGTLWDEQIRQQLRESDIAVVLVSQSFLDSRYCSDVEMGTFLKRCRDDGMIIFPIVLSPCEWERHEWIASRQFLPGGNETIEEHYTEPGKQKRLFLKIRQELRGAIARARANRAARLESEAAIVRPTPVVERRQLTILRCELVPTEPDGNPVDPEDLPEILHELSGDFQQVCTQVFERFEGNIVHSASGAVTVCFGHPMVHEDDSRRAVRAALALIETIGSLSARIEGELGVRLSIRAGAHTGVVVVDTNDPGFTDADATSAAARVQELAPLNGVMVSESTQELIDGYIETEEAGSVSAARQTLNVYRIVRDTGFDSRVQAGALTKLIGRDEEIGLLLDRWTETRRGNGQVVMLQAEAGVGKSRLIAEVKARTCSEPAIWIECRCSPYHQNSALFPAIGALEVWLGIDAGESNDEKLAKLEERLAPYASIGEIVPAVAALLSIPFEHKYPQAVQLNPRDQKQLTLEVMVQLVIERALENPAIFVVEDLHWIDPSTVEFLDILIEQAPTVPLLILFTYRPEYTPPQNWLSRPYASQITLDRLDREGVRQMALALSGGKALPEEVFEEIFAKTEGFPLFVEDLTRMVIESDLLVEHDDHFTLAGPFQSLAIPATLQETLMARLAKLATAKPVAQVGATIGREFVFEMLRAVGGFDDKTLVDELNKLVSAGLLYRRGLLSRAKYIFKHALVQEALQQSLLKKQRRQYHKVIAEVLEEKFKDVAEAQPELVAYHYDEAGDTWKAVEYWKRAAERALAHCANREALSHARRAIEALAETPDDEQRRTTELALRTIEGPALLALKGWAAPELGQCYHRARELCRKLPPTPKFFGVLRGIWTNHMVAARLDEALAIAGELFEIAFSNGNEDLLLEGRGALCDTLFWLGRPADSREQARQGFALYDLDRHHMPHAVTYGEDPATMFFTYSALSLALMGRPSESLEFTRGAIAVLDRFAHTHSRAFLLCGIAWNYIQLRDVEKAGEWAQKLIDISLENHFDAWLPLGRAMKAWSIAAGGDLAAGVPAFTAAREQWHATGAGVKACFYPALMADLHLRADLVDDAALWVKSGFAAAGACDDRYYFSELHRLAGDVQAARGDETKAIEAYEAALGVARTQQAKLLELRAATSLARLRVRRGEHETAAAELAPLIEFFEGEQIADVIEARQVAMVAELIG